MKAVLEAQAYGHPEGLLDVITALLEEAHVTELTTVFYDSAERVQ
jgi:hypothetical protein